MNILCIESAWSTDPDVEKQTVSNLLNDLRADADGGDIDYTRQYCASKSQLKRLMEQLDFKPFDVIYFASHGRPGKLDLARDTVSVETLADYMDGRATGKVIYFASCAVLNLNDDELRSIVKRTGAKYICGYTTFVDWTQSRAMDGLVLQAMAKYQRPTWLWKSLMKQYADLMKQTGFYMYW